jgi:hypothetical protein
VCIGLEDGCSDTIEKVLKRDLAAQIRPQHDRVHKESDQRFRLPAITPGNRRAYGNVVLPSETMKQQLKDCHVARATEIVADSASKL